MGGESCNLVPQTLAGDDGNLIADTLVGVEVEGETANGESRNVSCLFRRIGLWEVLRTEGSTSR
jgi:hypothetical protein